MEYDPMPPEPDSPADETRSDETRSGSRTAPSVDRPSADRPSAGSAAPGSPSTASPQAEPGTAPPTGDRRPGGDGSGGGEGDRPRRDAGPYRGAAVRQRGDDGGGGGGDGGGEAPAGDAGGPAPGGRRWLRWALPLVIAVAVGIAAGVAVAAAINMPRVETLTDFTPGLITELHGEDGETFATFALQRRVMLEENEVPEVLRQALLAVEDSSFYQHGGIDLPAIVRAQIANLRAGEKVEGASTLTMQLARELFLTREKTWRRKIEEALLAVELEKSLSKQQILTMYMNLMNVGHGNYGFAAASRYYFGKEVGELTVPEAAMLAGIVQRPSTLSPYRRPELVRERRNKVLSRMRAEGYVTEEQYREAVESPLGVVSHAPDAPFAPYFAEEVRQYLESTYGTPAVHEGGLQVWTTLDPQIQRAAEDALDEGVLHLDHRRGFRKDALETVGDEDPETWELPGWSRQPLVPGRWVQGIVLEADAREARVRVHDRVYTVGREAMEWTRRNPGSLLSRGDVAWFEVLPPEGAEEEVGAAVEDATGSAAEEVVDDGSPDAEPAGALPDYDPAELRLALEQVPEVQGAAVVLESATGAVRAMVGGWDFELSKFNRVTQAKRQVGSAFKPFIYGTALEMGYTAADTLYDAPTGFEGADQEISYWPRNHSRRYYGIITLRYALEHSINVAAVKLMDMVGTERVIDFARRAGIEAELPPYPSLALGTADISPLSMAAAYASIANQGTWVEPFLVERVEASTGQLLEQHAPVTRTVTDPRVAFVLTHMMEGVVDRGTAGSLRDLPIALAGKTGTTDDYTDAWFVGFTPRYTILVWVGYDVKRSLGRGMTGSQAALPIWADVVRSGLEDGWLREGETFTPPPGVVFEAVEYRTGLLPGAAAEAGESGGVLEEAFLRGTEPVQASNPRTALVHSLPWYQQRPFYIPKEGENMTNRNPEDDGAGGEAEAAE